MSQDRLASIENKLETLIVGQAGVLTHLGAVETHIGKIETQLGKVETRLDGVETHLSGVETRLSGVETRLGGVETRLGGVETRLGGVETRLGGVETRLSKVEVDEDEMKDHLKLIAEGHAATQDLIRRETKDLRVHFDKRIGLVEDAVRQHSAVIAVRSTAGRRARRK